MSSKLGTLEDYLLHDELDVLLLDAIGGNIGGALLILLGDGGWDGLGRGLDGLLLGDLLGGHFAGTLVRVLNAGLAKNDPGIALAEDLGIWDDEQEGLVLAKNNAVDT